MKSLPDLKWNYANDPKACLILAPGPVHDVMDSEMFEFVAEKISDRGVNVLRFEFPYQTQKRLYPEIKTLLPSKHKLTMHFLERLKMANSKLPMFIGGQTNGAKIATYVAGYKNTFLDLAGVVALGYPFYPQGQHKKMYQNTNHFASLKIPLLIVQGERDVFGEFPSVKANKSLIQGLP